MPSFSRGEYESLLYSVAEHYPEVVSASLRLYTNSATTAMVRGGVRFHNGLELSVYEYIDLTDGEILDYSYTVLRGGDKIRWYDPQPHPDDPTLRETFPHHRHDPPNIKHNRSIAPGITFQIPNLPTLIADCVALAN